MSAIEARCAKTVGEHVEEESQCAADEKRQLASHETAWSAN